MRTGTFSVVNATHVRDMRAILLVRILTVPATGKLDLRAHAVLAARVDHVRSLLVVIVAVQTGEADSVGNRSLTVPCLVLIIEGADHAVT